MDYLLCGNLPYPAWKKHISVQNLSNRRIRRYLVCRLKRPEARDFSHVRFTNRYIHVDYVDEYVPQSIKAKASKYQFDTLDCFLEELAILKLIAKNPTVKQQELVNATGKSIATVKRIMKSLREKNYIRRENGKRYGKWEMLI